MRYAMAAMLVLAGTAMAQERGVWPKELRPATGPATMPAARGNPLTADQARAACLARLEATAEYQAMANRVKDARTRLEIAQGKKDAKAEEKEQAELAEASMALAAMKIKALDDDPVFQEAKRASVEADGERRQSVLVGALAIHKAIPDNLIPRKNDTSIQTGEKRKQLLSLFVGKTAEVSVVVRGVEMTQAGAPGVMFVSDGRVLLTGHATLARGANASGINAKSRIKIRGTISDIGCISIDRLQLSLSDAVVTGR